MIKKKAPFKDPAAVLEALRHNAQAADSYDMDVYLHIPPSSLNIISVFDDLRFDRADADMLSPGMRKHVVARLGELGFKQKSGTVVEHKALDMRCHMPKFHALGASPFDIACYTNNRPQDYVIMTPTQTVCALIDHHPYDAAQDMAEALVRKQPINIYRILDFLRRKPAHEKFRDALGYLKHVQEQAVTSDPLRSMRAL